jgi:FkbM family methyltransferase
MREIVNFRGIQMYAFNVKDHFISRNLIQGNGWDEIQLDFIVANTDPAKAMIDVGGDIGTYTLTLNSHFKKVYCFEPNVEHYGMIVDSLALNDISNVDVRNEACSFESGKCNVVGGHLNQIEKTTGGQVDVVVLDEVIKDEISFIKIDVEGHEYSVLLGLENIIDKQSPLVYLETHPSIVTNSKTQSEEFLAMKGYSVLKEYSELDKVWIKL